MGMDNGIETYYFFNGGMTAWGEILFIHMIVCSELFYRYPENITPETEVEPKTMTIGMNNVFEVGCGILSELSDYL